MTRARERGTGRTKQARPATGVPGGHVRRGPRSAFSLPPLQASGVTFSDARVSFRCVASTFTMSCGRLATLSFR